MNKIYTPLFSLMILFSCSVFGQVFPYVEGFDTYTVGQPLSGDGGIRSTSHVYVTAHGVVGDCAEFQMSPAATHDTLLSPLIGPLGSHSFASFYFRAVTLTGGIPTLYNMTTGDKAQIIVSDSSFGLSLAYYTISSANQNTTANYIKVVVPIPSQLAGNAGWFSIAASNTSNHTWMLELDSLEVYDTLVIHPTLTTVSITSSSCRGDSSGAITIAASGAHPPYHYTWSNGDTTAAITHLPGGVYTVTVTDSLGAPAYLRDTVGQPQLSLLLDSLTHRDIVCRGSATGTAEVYAEGGTPGYTYLWSANPAQTTQGLVGVTAGTYAVTVTDRKGCTVTATTQITQPSTGMTAYISSTGSTGSDGTATITVTGGTGALSYLWTPTAQTTQVATGLSPGQYHVLVTDSLCTLSDSVNVTSLIGIRDIDNTPLSLYPNPATDRLHMTIDKSTQTAASVVIYDLSGRVALRAEAISGGIDIASLTDGVYIVTVTSASHTYTDRIAIQR